MSQTYNPILETVELRRLRIGSPLRAPAMGTALVLERAVGEPLVVWPGDRVPDARTGNYRLMHRVDVAIRGLAFTITASSSDAAFPFTVTVRFACQVKDPVAIARDQVQDMTAALSPSLSAVVRGVAAKFDAMQPTATETAISARLTSAYPLETVDLTGFSVSVGMVDAAEIVTARRAIRVQEMRRDALRPVAGGGREEMLAHIMSIDGGNPMSLLDRECEEREAETQAKLESLWILMGSKMEDFNVAEVRKQALSEFFPGESLGIAPKRHSFRDRIERRSRGELEAGQVVEGNVPADDSAASGGREEAPQPVEDARPAQPENGRPASRLRGSLGSRRRPDAH